MEDLGYLITLSFDLSLCTPIFEEKSDSTRNKDRDESQYTIQIVTTLNYNGIAYL